MSPIDPTPRAAASDWSPLPSDAWTDTIETLHLWSQIVGKVRTNQAPWRNHSWNAALYVTPRGLSTSAVPHRGRLFEVELDLLDHRLQVRASDGGARNVELEGRSVAGLHGALVDALESLDLPAEIHPRPNELEDAVPFAEDDAPRRYDRGHAEALHGALVQAHRVMEIFQAGFVGKVSPVHFFWGSFDMAVTRFSGREAPEHPGGFPNLPDAITREAYSHEVTSAGFWPGNRDNPEPIFYAYAYPSPDAFAQAKVRPDAAFWLEDLGEFALTWEAARATESPDDTVLAFFESTHEAAAELAGWDRTELERDPAWRPVPRHSS